MGGTTNQGLKLNYCRPWHTHTVSLSSPLPSFPPTPTRAAHAFTLGVHIRYFSPENNMRKKGGGGGCVECQNFSKLLEAICGTRRAHTRFGTGTVRRRTRHVTWWWSGHHKRQCTGNPRQRDLEKGMMQRRRRETDVVCQRLDSSGGRWPAWPAASLSLLLPVVVQRPVFFHACDTEPTLWPARTYAADLA